MEFDTFKVILTVLMVFMALAMILFMINQFIKSRRLHIADGYKAIDNVREEIRNSKRFLITQKFSPVFEKAQDALLRMKADNISPYKENYMIIATVPTIRGIAEKLQIEFKEVDRGTMVLVHAKPASKLPPGLDDVEGIKAIERFATNLNDAFTALGLDEKVDKRDIPLAEELGIPTSKPRDAGAKENESETKSEKETGDDFDIPIKEVNGDFDKYRELHFRQKANLPPKQKSSILDEKNAGKRELENISKPQDDLANEKHDDVLENNDRNASQNDEQDKRTEEKPGMRIVDLADKRSKGTYKH